MPQKAVRHQLLVIDALILRLPTLGRLRSRKACRDDGQHEDQEECQCNDPCCLAKAMATVLFRDLLKGTRCIGHAFVEQVVKPEVSVVLFLPTRFDRDILRRHIALRSYHRSLMTDRTQDSNEV